ncbi:MAG TPA: efflux RND transporter periplasmic adaptor subunit [Bacteroidota bacterium]|nr:efflux RND transporter periplasmic adaptor subunit [Bacteroidota bacterium]
MPQQGDVDLSRLSIERGGGSGESSPKSGRKSGTLLYIGGGLFLAIALFFFLRSALTKDPVVELTTVGRLSKGQANSVLTANGYVVAQRKASIASKATGRLVYLGYREGDVVREGEIIARIEDSDVTAAFRQAEADLNVAIADKTDAERSLERTKSLLDRQLVSTSDYDAAKARYDRVVATIASREASLKAAEVQVENTRIRAPFDGTILTKNADVGEVVAPFAAGASSRVAVVTIADMSSLEVEADVSESNIERVHNGQPCEISLDAYPEKRYRGLIDKIVPTADRAKATIMTKVKFLERDSRVLPEMSAKVLFLSNSTADSADTKVRVVVDPQAIVQRDGKTITFLVLDNTVTATPVTTSGSLGRYVEITTGLQPGDRVVLHPPDDLHTGMRVKQKE